MKCEMNKEYTAYLESKTEVNEPSLYQVLLHSDDFTPMEFVIGLLEKFFYMGRIKAAEVMLEARMQGKALCGLFAKDCAEMKVLQVVDYAKEHEQPLICSMEAAE